jgi:hypothetical protein
MTYLSHSDKTTLLHRSHQYRDREFMPVLAEDLRALLAELENRPQPKPDDEPLFDAQKGAAK